MDEFQSATSQLDQDSGDLAGAQEPDRQNHHQECPSAIISVDSVRDLGVVIEGILSGGTCLGVVSARRTLDRGRLSGHRVIAIPAFLAFLPVISYDFKTLANTART